MEDPFLKWDSIYIFTEKLQAVKNLSGSISKPGLPVMLCNMELSVLQHNLNHLCGPCCYCNTSLQQGLMHRVFILLNAKSFISVTIIYNKRFLKIITFRSRFE